MIYEIRECEVEEENREIETLLFEVLFHSYLNINKLEHQHSLYRNTEFLYSTQYRQYLGNVLQS